MKHAYLKKISIVASMMISGLLLTSEAMAQKIAQYSFPNSTGSEDSIAVDAQPANTNFSRMKRGTGVVPSGSAGTISASGWSTGALDPDDYYTFSVRPATGYKVSLDSIKLDERRSGTGIRDWAVRSSLDGYTTNLATFNVPDDTDTRKNNKITLGTAFDNLTTGVSFRIYGYTAEAAGGTWRLDSVEVYGSIQTTGTGPTNPTVGFAAASAAVAENVAGGTTTVAVNITNPSATAATTVNVALATTGTATAGTDFTFTSPTTLTWAAGDNTPKTVTITIIDDTALDPNETIILNLTNPSTGATLGTSTFTLTINDNEVAPIPTVTVASITVNDPVNFLPTQNGQKVKLVGTLYGTNQRTAGGLQLTLIDATGGVGIFTTIAAIVPTVAPVEGDRVRAIGTVGHFNGLTQLTLDSIVVLANNQTLVTPAVVTGPLTEAHESELITLANPVTLVTPSQWPTTAVAADVDVTDGVNTYRLRAVPSANLHTVPAPTGQFVLTGIGGQFDSTDPRDSGYQIIPRRLTDLRDVTGISEELSKAISVYPNPVTNVLNLNLSTIADKNATVSVVNALGQEVKTIPANANQINVANLPAGVYTLKVTSENGTAVKRFVKVN